MKRFGAVWCVVFVVVAGCAADSYEASSTTSTFAAATTLPVPVETSTSTTPLTTTSRPAVVYRLTSSAALGQAVDSASRTLRGRGASTGDKKVFSEEFHAEERTQQAAEFDGREYYIPEPKSAAADWVRTNYAVEVEAYAFAQQAEAFRGIIANPSSGAGSGDSGAGSRSACTANGVFLGGNVREQEFGADVQVRVVRYGADLEVRRTNFPSNRCGDWHFVDYAADFTVEFVSFGEDLTIRYVD